MQKQKYITLEEFYTNYPYKGFLISVKHIKNSYGNGYFVSSISVNTNYNGIHYLRLLLDEQQIYIETQDDERDVSFIKAKKIINEAMNELNVSSLEKNSYDRLSKIYLNDPGQTSYFEFEYSKIKIIVYAVTEVDYYIRIDNNTAIKLDSIIEDIPENPSMLFIYQKIVEYIEEQIYQIKIV